MKKIAYDLDGTIIISKFKNHWLKKRFNRLNPKVNIEDIKIIITARNYKDKKITLKTLKRFGMNPDKIKIIYNPLKMWHNTYVVQFKKAFCEIYHIDEYIDNDKEINFGIRELSGGKIKCRTV